jgi:hypothetical protein
MFEGERDVQKQKDLQKEQYCSQICAVQDPETSLEVAS